MMEGKQVVLFCCVLVVNPPSTHKQQKINLPTCQHNPVSSTLHI